MAKTKEPKAGKAGAGKAGKAGKAGRPGKAGKGGKARVKVKGAFLDRVTNLVLVLFLGSLVAQRLTGG